jgi:hypothetical protein
MNATKLKVTKLDEDQMKVVMCYELGALDVITQAEELGTEDAAKAMAKHFKKCWGLTIDKQTVYDLFSTFGGSEEGLKNIEVGSETAIAWLEGDKHAPQRLYSLIINKK